MKLREKMVVIAEKLGGVEIESRSGKYRTFSRPQGGYFFVGKAGALRAGSCATKSVDISRSPVVKRLLAELA